MANRNHNLPYSFNPFEIYGELFKLGVQTSKMMASSAEVIFYRTMMINKALAGQISWTDPEFTKLWQEKVLANTQAFNTMNATIIKKTLSGHKDGLEKNLTDGIKAITHSSSHYSTKAAANAKRLRSKTHA